MLFLRQKSLLRLHDEWQNYTLPSTNKTNTEKFAAIEMN